MRTLLKSEARAVRNASIPSGLPWFPELASRVQISIWDGSITQGSWAGSPVPWDSSNKFSAPFEYITIDCYDDKNNVVPRWSTDGSGRDTVETPPQVDPLPTDNRQQGTHGSAAIGMFSLVSVLAAACTAAMAAWAVL
ncbi:hypothetical protein HK105_209156 [Polyrhizophydium stewartii]|uniref:Uncharacterized protein n=1 Tax=Polyrhizophydium stewartii TaxID=2732419 RepID=A0ABR4MVU6_9FUNG